MLGVEHQQRKCGRPGGFSTIARRKRSSDRRAAEKHDEDASLIKKTHSSR
jgi:hypothetical protein